MSINKTLIYSLLSAAAITLMAACGKGGTTPDPGPDPDPDYPEIGSVETYKGTKIDKKANAIGIVLDKSTGKGIAGIPVSDGFSFVKTDENGVYQMTTDMHYCHRVFITLPAEYEVPLTSKGYPAFYNAKKLNLKKLNINDFELTPLAAPEDNWTFIGIGDPQCQTDDEVARYTNETIPDIRRVAESYVNPYCMTLGDIVFDSNNTWPGMVQSMSNVTVKGRTLPFFQTIGNHDHDSKTSDRIAAVGLFNENVGPENYSFNRGKVHIISMDDVYVTSTKKNSSPNGATWNYVSGFSEAQYKWFVQDLANVKDKGQKMILLCMHIPMRGGGTDSGSNFNKDKHYEDVLNALKEFNEAHIMIGHTHYYQNYIHSNRQSKNRQYLYEHVHGAACGAWWCCNSTVTGSPNGYTVYSIEGASIKDWVTRSPGREEGFQFRVYDGNQTYGTTYPLNWYTASQKAGSAGITIKGNSALKGCFVAEVWDDDDRNWTVEFWQNGAKVGNFTRIANGGCANVCASAFFFNEKGKNTDSWNNTTASHYWYFKPKSGQPAEETNWEVKATQTIPSSGVKHTYTNKTLTTSYDY